MAESDYVGLLFRKIATEISLPVLKASKLIQSYSKPASLYVMER